MDLTGSLLRLTKKGEEKNPEIHSRTQTGSRRTAAEGESSLAARVVADDHTHRVCASAIQGPEGLPMPQQMGTSSVSWLLTRLVARARGSSTRADVTEESCRGL